MDILQQQDKEYIAGTYARFPLTIEGGKGSVVWDDAGKIYTDLSSGIAVNTFGIADDEWIKAITEQAGKIQHMSNLYYTEPCVKLAQMLCDRTGMKKSFLLELRRGGQRMCNKSGEKIRRREARRGLLQYSYTEKQLPRQDDNHPRRNGSGCVPQRFPAADRGIYLC